MVFRGRGNPRARGFIRPFRARGRGRRPFVHHGQFRGSNRGFARGGHPVDEGLRITLRNPGRDRERRDGEEYDQRQRSGSREREPDRRDSYDDYKDDYGGEHSQEFEPEGARFDDERGSPHRDSGRSPPRKRQHVESVIYIFSLILIQREFVLCLKIAPC